MNDIATRWLNRPRGLSSMDGYRPPLLGDDKDAWVGANLHPAPDALYVAFTNAVLELFCGMTPAEASAAARANRGTTAGVIRFR